MFFDNLSSVNIDDWDEIELGVLEHVDISFSFVNDSLMKKLECHVKWHLH